MSDTIIVAIIGVVAAVAPTVAAAILGRKNAISKSKLKDLLKSHAYIEFFSPKLEPSFIDAMARAPRVKMFTVNSYELLNRVNSSFEHDASFYIRELYIMVRKKVDESENDIRNLDSNIKQWKRWLTNGRIAKLKIVYYDQDAQHTYTLIGNSILFTGVVYFDQSKPTHTNVDYDPIVFYGDNSEGAKVIERFDKQFDNFLDFYEKKGGLLFDSSNVTI
ncbi:hypothetical protein FACS1894191_5200 [Clostridia bacterium]|nr:hypothetical protein FACS1894191_5200 [Clostridia bacterium]